MEVDDKANACHAGYCAAGKHAFFMNNENINKPINDLVETRKYIPLNKALLHAHICLHIIPKII